MNFLENKTIGYTTFSELRDLTFPTEKGIEFTPEYDPNDAYLYEDNNPEDTITVATFNNEIDDSPSHSWKQETTYYVCQVPRKEKTYILFSIDWDDNWGRYERSIHAAVEECDSIEKAKTVLLKKYAVDRLSNRGGGEFAEFSEQLIMTE